MRAKLFFSLRKDFKCPFESTVNCPKNVQIRSFFWSVLSRVHSKYGKIRTRKNSVFGHFSHTGNFILHVGLAWVCRWTTSGSLLAYQGHGIAEFRNQANFFHSFINKHAHVLDLIDYEKVVPKGPVSDVIGKSVYFTDGSTLDVDIIILCTGYITSFPFLPEKMKCDLTDLYKYAIHPEDHTLSFIGYARPIIGSIPMLSEMQARFICRIISGQVSLVSKPEIKKIVEKDKIFWNNYFKNTSQRISTLVEGYTYLDDLAKLCNCSPDYWALLRRNPKGFFTAIFAPANPCMYTLNDPKKESSALKTLKKHSSDTITPLNLITIILLRLIMFDWFCDVLGTVKFKIQTSWFWKCIRNYPFIRLLDYIWCTPKRCLFDNKSRF